MDPLQTFWQVVAGVSGVLVPILIVLFIVWLGDVVKDCATQWTGRWSEYSAKGELRRLQANYDMMVRELYQERQSHGRCSLRLGEMLARCKCAAGRKEE